MWDLRSRNRGVFVLISVLSGCAIFYNAWGAILALTVSIILVIYVCYSLLTNDSILSPQALFIAEYVREGGQELAENIIAVSHRFSSALRKLSLVLTSRYRIYVAEKMSRFRQSGYQLSNDAHHNSRTSSWSDLTANQLSPIPKKELQENIMQPIARRLDENYSASKTTSTPIVPWHRESKASSNGGIGLFTPARPLRQETRLNYGPNYNSTRANETVFSPEGSPWGTSISPKIQSKAAGVKTVQTIAGPLLASTRYNIDTKTYSDVTSPGLSTRLAKYATEANTKLTHQSQYSTGQFPKVNLSTSPLPLVSAKNAKVRTPVTVRIAPPETSRYSPPERQRLISDVCKAENRAPSSVAQVLREISLKRHASREDVSAELVKKQRTEGLYDEKLDELEEITQKRGREDSPNSEEEAVSKSSQSRPVKKTKTPSCYDVLNSLSSSSQYSSGVKRKASTLDLSRSGTPDIEKHFKASETAPAMPKLSATENQPRAEGKVHAKNDSSRKNSPSIDVEMSEKLQKQTTVRVKGILKGTPGEDVTAGQMQKQTMEIHAEVDERKETREKKMPRAETNKPVNFTEKLFMKAEPETNERLRTLIEEQGNIRAKFTTDDADEIKKEDIVNMRQTSMRARLQSMFDAISGKSKKINPDVVIHAEAASEPDVIPETQASQATLSSTTSTTSVNTSPITTTDLVPVLNDPSKQCNKTAIKHVTFNLPSTHTSLNSYGESTNVVSSTGYKPSADKKLEAAKILFGSPAVAAVPSMATSTTSSSTIPPNTNATSIAPPPAFSIATTSIQNSTISLCSASVGAMSSLNSVVTTSPAPPAFTASSSASDAVQNTSVTQTSKSLVIFGAPSIPPPASGSGSFNSEPNKLSQSFKPAAAVSSPMPSFSFGAPKMSPATASFGTNVQAAAANSQGQPATNNSTGAPTQATSSAVAVNDANQTQHLSTTSGIMTLAAPAPAPAFTFGGGNAIAQSTNSGNFSFTSNAMPGKSQAPPAFGNPTTPVFGNSIAPAPAATIAQTQNPPMFGSANSFQSTQVPATTATQNAPSSFGGNPPAYQTAVTSAAQKTPSFGTVATSNAQPFFGANVATTGTTFAFGNTPTQTTAALVPAFGGNISSTAVATNSTFSFGASSAAGAKSGFSFGANTPTTISASGASTGTGTGTGTGPGPGTGTSGQIPAFGSAVPVFGTPSTTAPPAFGAPTSTTSSVFGASTTNAPPAFGAPSSTGSSALFSSPATATSSGMFNSPANQSTFGAAAPNSFGAQKMPAPPAYGAQTSESTLSFGAASTGNNTLFSNASMNTPTNAGVPSGALPASTASTTFGANVTPKNLFSQTKSPPSFAAATSVGFGSTATPVFGTPNSSFGAAGNSAAPGGLGFGTTNSATPVFGAQKQTAPAPPPAFGSTNSAFGTNAAAAPSGFGAVATNFRTQNTTASNFGTAGAVAFGTDASTPFGSQSQSSAPAFGAQNATAPSFATVNNNPAPSFGFAGNQGQTQQNTGFAFTGNAAANNATTTTTSPFQFGGAPAKSEGFNFSTATTTPNLNFGSTASPSFGTPAQGTNMFGTASPAVPSGGMFSIGAGSTAPRSRSTRGARRQR